jgi:hypothetical protein
MGPWKLERWARVVRGDRAYRGSERSSTATIEDIFVSIVYRSLGVRILPVSLPVSTAAYSIKATAPIKLIRNGGMPMLAP